MKIISRIVASAAMLLVFSSLSGAQIRLNLRNVTIREVIATLSRSQNISVVVSSADVDINKKVSIDTNDASIDEVLSIIFSGQDVSWTIDGNNVSVSKKEAQKPSVAPAKSPVISGRVLDENGEPLIGAAISINGGSAGFITDLDGHYELKGVSYPAKMVVSFVGYSDTELILTGTETVPYDIRIDSSNNLLNEVVVVGYGTQKRSSLSGAVTTIDSKKINDRPVVSAANALQGADPSINLTFGTGAPNSGYDINIRGALSINSSSPLILADGVEVSLSQINPNDIESVTVLKDASSCAIYGAKASAGVILINTKQGKRGDNFKITYNGRVACQYNTTSTDFITSGYDAVTIINEFLNNSPQPASVHNAINYTEANGRLQKLLDRRNDKVENPERPWIEKEVVGGKESWMYYANFDWYSYLFNRVRPQNEHNISLSGGSDKISYYVSGRYLGQDGLFKLQQDTYHDYSIRAKVSARMKKWMKFSTNISFDNNSYRYGGFTNIEKTYSYLHKNVLPCFMPYNSDGTLVVYPAQHNNGGTLGTGAIVGYMASGVASNVKTNRYLTILTQVDFNLGDHLVLTGSYDFRTRQRLYRYRTNDFEYSRYPGELETFSGQISSYEEETFNYDGHNANVYATYDNNWGRHYFKAVAGGQYQTYRNTDFDCYQNHLTSDELSSFAVGTGIPVISQSITAYKTLGFFGRVNYDWAERYIFEASARGDGSSRFAKGSRWAFFPSASAAWRISEENFFAPAKKVVDNLKLRASVGSLGNQQVSNYAYIESITSDVAMDYTFDNRTLSYQANISNPISSDLTWETVTTYDIGVDVNMLKSRLAMSLDGYVRDTRNMLTTSLTLPDVYGAKTPKANCANLRTMGWELSVRWNDSVKVLGKPFNYNVSATLGDYKTRITKYNNPKKLLSDYYEGMVLGEIWGYHVDGLYRNDAEAAIDEAEITNDVSSYRIHKSDAAICGNKLRAGDVKYVDVNGDHRISPGASTYDDHGDMSIIGNSLPRYSYSFTLGFDWMGIDFSAFFQGVGHRDWYPQGGVDTAYEFWSNYGCLYPSFIPKGFIENVWTEDNPDAYFPRARGYAANTQGQLGVVNDRYIQNVAYLRLKNLTLGYTLEPRLTKKIGIDKLRVYFTGENLFYISPLRKYCKIVDPENAGATGAFAGSGGIGTSWTGGSGTAYPYSTVLSLGLDIQF